jgi:hypothetical protein
MNEHLDAGDSLGVDPMTALGNMPVKHARNCSLDPRLKA